MGWAEANRYDLIKRLTSRFRIVEGNATDAKLLVAKEVICVTNADELLKSTRIYRTSGISAVAGDTNLCHTIPLGKRWKILLWQLGTSSGVGLANGMNIVLRSSPTIVLRIYTPGSAGDFFYWWGDKGLVLSEGDIMYCNATDTATMESTVFVEEEDAF